MKKILMTALFFVIPLTSCFAFTCPSGSVFQKAIFVKNDGNIDGWDTFQSAPQVANGWTIGLSAANEHSTPVTNLTEANALLKTVYPQYTFDNGVYCSYSTQYGGGVSFWATKTDGPSPSSHPQF